MGIIYEVCKGRHLDRPFIHSVKYERIKGSARHPTLDINSATDTHLWQLAK